MDTRITIKDIAKELSVHHSTVSRALRNDPRVKKETSEMIREYALAHGYQVNINALTLRGSVKNVLAVVVPNINHQFFSSIISHFTEIANSNDYVVSIFQTNESLGREMDIINTLIKNNVAGVIASVSMETTESEHFRRLGQLNIPLVLFDRVLEINGVSKVRVNNAEIIGEAVNMLVSNGYSRIAHVSGTSDLNVFRERQDGYVKAVSDNRLKYNKIHKVTEQFSIDSGVLAAGKLFAENVIPDAIICDSDYLLLGIIQQLRRSGFRIPHDVGLVGFGNNPAMEIISPCITTVVQPAEAVASSAFKALIEKIKGKNKSKTENIVLSAKIIERDSSRKYSINQKPK